MSFVDKNFIKKIYFNRIATTIARKAPEEIKKKRGRLNTEDNEAFHLAARFVANFMYTHGMEMALYISSFESAGFIPRRGLPEKISRQVGFGEGRNLYQQLMSAKNKHRRSPQRGHRVAGEFDTYDSHNHHKRRHHTRHHHSHHHKNQTPTEVYREKVPRLTIRMPKSQVGDLGFRPGDPADAENMYAEYKAFLMEKKRAEDAARFAQFAQPEVAELQRQLEIERQRRLEDERRIQQLENQRAAKAPSSHRTPPAAPSASYYSESATPSSSTKKSSTVKSSTTKTSTAKSSTTKTSTAQESTEESTTKETTTEETATTQESSTRASSTKESSQDSSEPEAEEEEDDDEEEEDKDEEEEDKDEEEEDEEEEDFGEEEGEGEE